MPVASSAKNARGVPIKRFPRTHLACLPRAHAPKHDMPDDVKLPKVNADSPAVPSDAGSTELTWPPP